MATVARHMAHVKRSPSSRHLSFQRSRHSVWKTCEHASSTAPPSSSPAAGRSLRQMAHSSGSSGSGSG